MHVDECVDESNGTLSSLSPLQSQDSSDSAPHNLDEIFDESSRKVPDYDKGPCSQNIPVLSESEEDIDFSPICPTPSPSVESSPAHIGPNLSYYPIDGAIITELGRVLKD